VAWGINGEGLTLDLEATETATLMYNDVYDNEFGDYGAVVGERTGIDGNISADPMLMDFSADRDFDNDDYHLNHGSPCDGTGDPLLSSEDGLTSDIGAYPRTDTPIDDADGDGYSPDTGGDCDDTDPTVHPDAPEICGDLVDNNCNGLVDEDCEPTDTGDTGSMDTGTIDTGTTPVDTGDSDDDRTDEGSMVVPGTSEDLYKIEGEGCRCSAAPARNGLVWLMLAPLVARRRWRR
jgi:hypothetical protein